MPRCRICGKDVRSGSVIHSECISEAKEDLLQLICDDYCKHVPYSADEEELEVECAKCKIAEMLG